MVHVVHIPLYMTLHSVVFTYHIHTCFLANPFRTCTHTLYTHLPPTAYPTLLFFVLPPCVLLNSRKTAPHAVTTTIKNKKFVNTTCMRCDNKLRHCSDPSASMVSTHPNHKKPANAMQQGGSSPLTRPPPPFGHRLGKPILIIIGRDF